MTSSLIRTELCVAAMVMAIARGGCGPPPSIVLHELMHQRGLTDLYDYDVWHRFGVAEVGIMEGARAVAGSDADVLHFEGPHDQAALEIPVVMHRW